MAHLFGREWRRDDLLRRVGDISQIGGARPVVYREGPEAGVEAIEVRTGSGFAFTVLPGRGMDIGMADYRGASLCWRSSTGEVAASFYEPEGEAWLRGFHGGLLVTSGLTTAGWPSVDQGVALPLHGRASYLPARNVYADGDWEGEDYVIRVQGRTRETIVYGENVRLTRRITARLGESCFFLHDTIENLGFAPVPHMLCYHINPGFPVVDAGSELIASSRSVRPFMPEWESDLAEHARFDGPRAGWDARVFFHEVGRDADGFAYTAVVNRTFPGGGHGLYVKQRADELPYLWQWKQTGEGTYVVGIEPSNCHGLGRADERARGTLRHLAPGERQEYHLELGVLESAEAIESLARAAAAARGGA